MENLIKYLELLDNIWIKEIEYNNEYCHSHVFMDDVEGSDKNKYRKATYTPDSTIKARELFLATGVMVYFLLLTSGEEEYIEQGMIYCLTYYEAFYQEINVNLFGMDLEEME